jgi:hypothetical protein
MEFEYRDVNLKGTEDVASVSRVITNILYASAILTLLMSSKANRPGEYRLQPLAREVFDSWMKKHPDIKTRLQYCNPSLVISIVYPVHDRSANIVIQELLMTTLRICPGSRLMFGTGRNLSFVRWLIRGN